MSRDINPFGLRMPQELRERIEAAAEKAGRSLNAEILQRLQDSLVMDDAKLTASVDQIPGLREALQIQREQIVDEMIDRMDERFQNFFPIKMLKAVGVSLDPTNKADRKKVAAAKKTRPPSKQ